MRAHIPSVNSRHSRGIHKLESKRGTEKNNQQQQKQQQQRRIYMYIYVRYIQQYENQAKKNENKHYTFRN